MTPANPAAPQTPPSPDRRAPHAALLWLPALGVPARKYQRLAAALAARGIACHLHEWRGTGEHPARPSRQQDWGYAELLLDDIPASLRQLESRHHGLPMLLGGHSIGAQFAVLAAALHGAGVGLVAVGGGVPHWRHFRGALRWVVGGFGLALPPLTGALGVYPGHRLGFAGREAGGLMRDWAQTVRRGHYDGLRDLPANLGARIAQVRQPLLGLRLADDRLVPEASMRALLAATGSRSRDERVLDAQALGVAADHFAWMRAPDGVAEAIAGWWTTEAASAAPALSS
jgi:predicted alpha/beta hydrolase